MVDLFLHIHKTGGTTLNTALKWVYGPSNCYTMSEGRAKKPSRWFEEVSPSDLRSFSLISGHFPFGLGEHVEKEHRYFTMLRHPVNRVISRYYQVKMSYPSSNVGRMGLEEFASKRQKNLQTRMVAGLDDYEDTNSVLQLAKKRLLDDFAAFGITERYNESLILIKRKMQWTRSPFYVRGKVTKGKRPSISEIPDPTIDMIREANASDLEFYAFAAEHFESLYRNERGIEKEVDRFEKLNAIVERIAPYPLGIYRTVRSYL